MGIGKLRGCDTKLTVPFVSSKGCLVHIYLERPDLVVSKAKIN